MSVKELVCMVVDVEMLDANTVNFMERIDLMETVLVFLKLVVITVSIDMEWSLIQSSQKLTEIRRQSILIGCHSSTKVIASQVVM